MGMTTPWINASDLRARPRVEDIDATILTLAATQASELVYLLSGRRFPGPNQRTIRPAARPFNWDVGRWNNQLSLWGFPYGFSMTWGVCQIAHNEFGFCANARQLDLITNPVREVTLIKIDGQSITPSSISRVDDGHVLTRTDGQLWPTCQLMHLPDTAVGTFSVTYTFGEDAPRAGKDAAVTLGIELARFHANKEHKLPSRVSHVVRQDVSMTTLDPMQFMTKEGLPLTGIWEVDLFIKSVNPHGAAAPPVVWSPDRQQLHEPGTHYP